MDQAAKQK